MHKKTNIFLLVLILFISHSTFSKTVYDTDFHNVEMITENASATKSEVIKIISKKSFLNIIDKILTHENKNFFLENFEYERNWRSIYRI